MKSRLKKAAGMFMLICMMAVSVPFGVLTAYAGNAKITFSDPSVTAGEEFNVTMKVTSTTGENLGSVNIMLSYDSSMMEYAGGDGTEGGAGSIHVTQPGQTNATEYAYSIKFKALSSGSAKLTVNTQEIYDADSKMVTLDHTGSSAITITPGSNASNDALLNSMKISPGTLTPAFSPDVTDYSVSVAGDVPRLTVSATTANGGAKVVIGGNEDLKNGDNTVTCRVTAEDGQTVKDYIIHVTKEEGTTSAANEAGDLSVSLNGGSYTVAAAFDESQIPEGFEAQDYTYHGFDVRCAKSTDQKNLTLLYLTDSTDQGAFFIYNETSGAFSPFAQVFVSERTVTIVLPDEGVELPEGFKEETVTLGGVAVTGWIWGADQSTEYCILYGMNAEGQKNFYRYDLTEKTIQRYFSDPAAEATVSAEQYDNMAVLYNSLLKDYNRQRMMLYIFAGAGLVLLVVVILLIIMGRHASEPVEDDDADEEEDEEDEEEQYTIHKPKKQKSKEELYLMGEEVSGEDTEKEAAALEPDAEKIEKELKKNLADHVSEDKDDFEFFDLQDKKI